MAGLTFWGDKQPEGGQQICYRSTPKRRFEGNELLCCTFDGYFFAPQPLLGTTRREKGEDSARLATVEEQRGRRRL